MKPIILSKFNAQTVLDFPEIFLIGRSNSGKSTLINAFFNQKVAFTAKSPGKTKTINLYKFKNIYLADFPGYGFSKNSSVVNNQIIKLIHLHFASKETFLIFHICSIEGLTKLDLEIKNFFDNGENKYILLLNKIDKFGPQKTKTLYQKIFNQLNLEKEKILLISGKEKTNVHILKKKIIEWTTKNKCQ